MTAQRMKGDRERCLEAGMDAYVSKPIRSRELFDLECLAPVLTVPKVRRPVDGVRQERDLGANGCDVELMKELASLFLQECPREWRRSGKA